MNIKSHSGAVSNPTYGFYRKYTIFCITFGRLSLSPKSSPKYTNLTLYLANSYLINWNTAAAAFCPTCEAIATDLSRNPGSSFKWAAF